MVTVAIAGGGSALASNIIAAILATKKHTLVVLTRSPRPDLEAQGAIVKPVDYSSHAQLVQALQGVDTVYSCIWAYGPAIQTTQLALLDAAKEAGVRRFAPSEWSVPAYDAVAYYKPKEAVWEAVRKSGLEYTRFITGIWMNVWGPGAPHDEEGARAGYAGPAFLADIRTGSITVPGDGTGKISATHMVDVGRYAAAALDFDEWEPDSVVVGDEFTVNELAEKIERVTGRTLRRDYISLEAIDAVLEGGPDPGTRMIHEFYRFIVKGGYGLTPNVNQRVPEIGPVKVEEFLKKHWGA